MEKGYVINIIEGYVFRTGTPLKAYSEAFTAIKNEAEAKGDKPTRTIAKLFLNSLYGKFASTYFINASIVAMDAETLSIIEKLYKINRIMDVDQDMKVINYNVNPNHNARVDKDTLRSAFKSANKALNNKAINIPIAAAITAHARIVLYKLFIEVEARGGVMCYTDTDSVFA